ncbi:MAG: hypothetical protein M3Y38_00595, partial [Actinomycetota bacterium]|nr:hypothetical protein [Actinomycetota bacterium]
MHVARFVVALRCLAAGAVILGLMENASRIPDRINEDIANIVSCWQARRRGDNEDGVYDRMLAGMEELVSVFVAFLRSTE